MNLVLISSAIMPVVIIGVIAYGVIKNVPIYETFVEGAKEGIGIAISIFPYILGMVVAINLLVDSKALEMILKFSEPFFNLLNIPSSIVPMAIMRPISGSASLVLLNDIFKVYGPDSYLGRLGSLLQGGTETTIYVIALYFGSVGIKRIRHALWVGLLTDLLGLLASLWLMSIFL